MPPELKNKSSLNSELNTPDRSSGDMDKKVILIAEDDSRVGESLRLLLKKKGHEVVLAPNGKEALQLLRHDAVDLVLTDVVMPKMDGIELLEALNGLRPETEVIVISAQGTIEKAVQAMKLGAFGA